MNEKNSISHQNQPDSPLLSELNTAGTKQDQYPIETARQLIEQLLPYAIGIYTQILKSSDVSMDMKFKAAKMIIEMSALGKNACYSDNQTRNGILEDMSTDELLQLRMRAQEIISGMQTKESEKLSETQDAS